MVHHYEYSTVNSHHKSTRKSAGFQTDRQTFAHY